MNNAQVYEEEGWALYRGLIPPGFVDDLLAEYRGSVLPSQDPLYRVTTNTWKPNEPTEHGYLKEGLKDVHDYRSVDLCRFGDLVKRILCAAPLREALSELTGRPSHSLVQSMFFDFNANASGHQDCYYLDSIPHGHLLGVWIALEEIHEDAGRFYVIPGSQRARFDLTPEEITSNELYVKKIGDYVEQERGALLAPPMRKGDALFWNSRTVHGSLSTQDHRHSRKSLTGHYLPEDCVFGTERDGEYPCKAFGLYNEMPYLLLDHEYSRYRTLRLNARNVVTNRFPAAYHAWRAVRDALRSVRGAD